MARQDIIFRMRLAGEDFDREFKAKFSELENSAERQSLAAGSRSGGSFTKGFLGAAGLAGLGTAIGTAISSAADLGAEISSTSRQFNIGAEELQIWRQAASSAGVSASEFNGSLASLTQKIGEANAGNRAAQQSFVDLGIGFQTTAGQARATDAVMLDLAERIAAIEDPAERLRIGTQLLGDEFKTLYPLLLDGADGFNTAAAEMSGFGGVLSQEELQNLNKLNGDIQEMKDQLSRSVAQVVAQNAGAVSNFASELANFADQAIKAASAQIEFAKAIKAYDEAAANGVGDAELTQRLGVRSRAPRGVGEFLLYGGQNIREYQPYGNFDDRSFLTDRGRSEVARLLAPDRPRAEDNAAAPRVTGGGGQRRRTGGGAARRDPTVVAAEREAERAAKEAIRNEEQLQNALARTLRAQQDSADVQRIRATQGEEAAAIAEAELGFLRQHPLAVHDTVEALAVALGITKELTQADKDRLQLLISQGDAAQKAAGAAAGAEARGEIDAKDIRDRAEKMAKAKREFDELQREAENAILDVADIYETAFRGGTKDLWANFKDEGTRIIAEIAAQWTLSLIAGQPFNFNAAAGGALGRSPLASIFGGIGAANDNGLIGSIAGNEVFQGGGGGLAAAAVRTTLGPRVAGAGGAAGALGGLGGIGSALPVAFGVSQLSNVVGGGLANLLGIEYSQTGGSLFGALGGIVGGLLKGTKRGSVTVGNNAGQLGVTGSQGNSRSREDAAAAGAGSLIDAIFSIANQLGGKVDSSRGSVSLGIRKDSFRVDPTGRGITKIGNGAVDFGSDQEAAIRFAVQDLIKDGIITGISQASQNLLQKGGDLEAQIEKALLIEAVRRLLKERLNPLGAALDDLYDRFKLLSEALREGGASAQQVADAQRLYELEKAEAIASIGAASQTLQDFLASLNAGSNSPLSLREQRAEAERQLSPFLAQITAAETARAEVDRLRGSGASAAQIEAAEAAAGAAAGAINQDGFTQASQLLLSISRQGNASSASFFSDFDRIRALTGQAAGFVDQASAQTTDSRDPFGSAIAQNTQDAALILSDQAAELRDQGETLRQIAAVLSGGGGGGFTREPRQFATDRR